MNETVHADNPPLATDAERLEECYALLIRIVRDSRPIVGGYREMARKLLVRHGIEENA
jgi:hypothetical protein